MARQAEQTNELEMESVERGGKSRKNGQPGGERSERGDERSRQMEGRYQVRQVTNIQASWTETERGEEGKFTLQLILDNGVEEYILEVDSDDIDPMLRLFKISDHTTFDLDRKVLMFSNLKVK